MAEKIERERIGDRVERRIEEHADVEGEIERGEADEARLGPRIRRTVFWLVVTYARCLEALTIDAPELAPRASEVLRALLADLGIRSFADFQASTERTRALLPEVLALSEQIIAERSAPTG